MKKQIILISLLLTTPAVQSAEIVPTNSEKRNRVALYFYHEKCDRVARYFIKHTPDMKLFETFNNFQKLDYPVQFLIREHAAEKELTTLMLITVPADIFISIMQSIVPQYEIKQKVKLGTSEYTEYIDGYAEHKPYIIMPMLGAAQTTEPEITEIIPINQAQQEILAIKTSEAFSLLADYANQRTITIKDVVEDCSFIKSSLDNSGGFEDGNLKKEYNWSFDDCLHTTAKQRNKLCEIADAHNGKFDKRYTMTQEDINLLMPIKDIINENALFKHLQIGIVCEPPTKLDKIKDVLLLAAPLSIVEGVIPQLIYNNINGKLQGVLGGIASYGSGFVVGNWIFPTLDSWNTHALTIHKTFGPNNKTIVEKKWSFAILSLFHYIMHALAEKALNVPTLSYQAIGYTLHGLRVLSGVAGVIDMRSYFNWHSWSKTFAETFHLKKYNHPLKRRNKDDKSYTLIDLLNAQPVKKT